MKKLFLLLLLSSFFINSEEFFSQSCTIDYSYTTPGLYPDTMPVGYIGQPYSEDISFVMPLDTMGATITNFNIVNIALPVGLNWQCNNVSNGCNYNPQNDPYGCVNIYGTPLLAGSYDIEVSILVNVVASGNPINNIPVSFFVFMEVSSGSPGGGNTGFSMSNTNGCLPLNVDFYNNNLGQLAYNWDFGNGITSTLENPPSQQYNSAGDYIITYEAYNNLDTIDLYTLTSLSILNVTEDIFTGFPWGWELFNGNQPDPYFILYENGTLIYQSTYVYNNSGPLNWTMNLILDPNKVYEVEVMDADETAASDNNFEFLAGADDYIGSHTINLNGCGNCNAGSYSDVSYSVTYQQILPVPFVQSVDTIHVYDYPGQPNINYDPVNLVLLSDSSQYALQWYINDTIWAGHTNPTDTISESGWYHVVAFNNFGCFTSSDTIYALYCDPNQIVPISIDSNLDLVTFVPIGWTVQWFENSNIINGATNETFTPSQSGNYSAIVTSPVGCSYSSSNYVYSVGIELNTANLWSVYPNPANDIVNIILGSSIIAESINIYDLSGRLLEQFNINGKKELQVNVSSYPKGIYLMNIHSNNGTLTKKLILGN